MILHDINFQKVKVCETYMNYGDVTISLAWSLNIYMYYANVTNSLAWSLNI